MGLLFLSIGIIYQRLPFNLMSRLAAINDIEEQYYRERSVDSLYFSILGSIRTVLASGILLYCLTFILQPLIHPYLQSLPKTI
jgi:hypothetical protein